MVVPSDSESPSVDHGAHAGKAKVAMRLQGLRKTYPGAAQPAVLDISLDVHDGEIVTLLGPSGCGKTTTLRMAAGLEVPDDGDIFFGDTAVVLSSRRLCLPRTSATSVWCFSRTLSGRI